MGEEKETQWQLTKKVYRFNVRVPTPLYDAMLRTIESGAYYNSSEFITDILQKYFKENGVKVEARVGGEEPDDSTKKLSKDTAIMNARVSRSMMNAVDQIVDSGFYFNISHYFREAIRKDLESRGLKT